MSQATSTPAIKINGAGYSKYPLPRRDSPSPYGIISPSPSGPMAIPNAREVAPPPLPPPRIIDVGHGHDPGWQWGQVHNQDAPLGSIKPGSSLLGGSLHARARSEDEKEKDLSPSRRNSSISALMIDPELTADSIDLGDDERTRRPSMVNHRLQSETKLGQDSHHNSSAAYDSQLLSRLGGGAGTGRRPSAPYLSVAERAASPSSPNNVGKLNQLMPLAVPERRLSAVVDSPVSVSRGWLGSMPSSAAISPGFTAGFRSPLFEQSEQSFRRQGSVSGIEPSTSRSIGSNDEQSIFMDMDGMEENGMRDLQISERSPAGSDEFQLSAKAGSKRRSPPTDPVRSERPVSGANDLYHRRSSQMLVNRDFPVHKAYHKPGSLSDLPVHKAYQKPGSLSDYPVHKAYQKPGSLSSTMSSVRTAASLQSWALSASSIASSATSYNDRLSPGVMSPSIDPDFGPPSPFSHGRSMNISPRGSISKGFMPSESENGHNHNRALSTETATSHARQDSAQSKMQGLYICECCPKKPRKFETADELRIHEAEKQYQCQFCSNRFKNKNEAERHQNSLHLRRHSWSCVALPGPEAAFHPSANNPQTHDSCGYCGEEFTNNPPDWQNRTDHLNNVHKFGECNQAKKFFRADHFRQHLKHSHAGTSGKWTNQLENACMKDEIPAQPMHPDSRAGSISGPSGAGHIGFHGPASMPKSG